MARILTTLLTCLLWAAHVLAAAPAAPTAIVSVRNPLPVPRSSETIVLQAADLRSLLAVEDVRKVHVREQAGGHDLLVQAVDVNDDGVFEQLLFQIDIGPQETRKFLLSVGDRQVPSREQYKAYGRFVRERRDDFAWENDRIAHRMYGEALETWAQEPLTSSAVDVWTKRVPRLVVNDWYMTDDYHRDHGEGADLYSAGSSRGCGGNGLWIEGRLHPSANFRNSRVLANGPIRVMFELTYGTWTAAGLKVSEVKRITLDAGQNFDRFESHYSITGNPHDLAHAVGIKKGSRSSASHSREHGWLSSWEPLQDAGELGCAVIVDPAAVAAFSEDKSNYLVAAKIPADGVAAYYAGFGWTRSGQFPNAEKWDEYVTDFAARVRAPLEVNLTKDQ